MIKKKSHYVVEVHNNQQQFKKIFIKGVKVNKKKEEYIIVLYFLGQKHLIQLFNLKL